VFPRTPFPAYPRLLEEEPLLWKEAYRDTADLGSYFSCGVLGLFLYFLIILVPFAATLTGGGTGWEGLNRALRVLFVLLMTAWSVLTAFRTVGSLSRERDQRTLDALLTLPLSHRAVLRACWVGGIARYRYLGYCLALCLLVGLLTGAFHPLAVVLLILAASSSLALLAGLGIWLAMVSRTSLWAYVGMALVLLVYFGGSWIFLFGGAGWEESPAAWDSHLLQVGLNPLASWWRAGFTWADLADAGNLRDDLLRPHLQGIWTGTGLLAFLAYLSWTASVARLRSLQQ
jgi:hypothetical protein